MSTLPMAPPPAAPDVSALPEDAQRFVVDGMDCASCAQTVEKVVSSLEGADAVQVSFGNATLLVGGSVSAEAVAAALDAASAHAVAIAVVIQADMLQFSQINADRRVGRRG